MVAQLRLSNPHVFLSLAVWKTRPRSRAHIPSSSSSPLLSSLHRAFPCRPFSRPSLFFFTFVPGQTRLSFLEVSPAGASSSSSSSCELERLVDEDSRIAGGIRGKREFPDSGQSCVEIRDGQWIFSVVKCSPMSS